MGWLYSYNIRSKKEMVAYLRRPERFGQDHELLRATTVGNHHWYLCRNRLTGLVYIGLDKMTGGIKDGWGYKDMDESVGPCEVDCPLSYLAQASQATGYAIEWRFNVQDFHAKKSARPDPGGSGGDLWSNPIQTGATSRSAAWLECTENLRRFAFSDAIEATGQGPP
jgi:hypothetical protein